MGENKAKDFQKCATSAQKRSERHKKGPFSLANCYQIIAPRPSAKPAGGQRGCTIWSERPKPHSFTLRRPADSGPAYAPPCGGRNPKGPVMQSVSLSLLNRRAKTRRKVFKSVQELYTCTILGHKNRARQRFKRITKHDNRCQLRGLDSTERSSAIRVAGSHGQRPSDRGLLEALGTECDSEGRVPRSPPARHRPVSFFVSVNLRPRIQLEQLDAAIGAGGDKLQLAGLIMTSVDGHYMGISAATAGRSANRRASLCASLAPIRHQAGAFVGTREFDGGVSFFRTKKNRWKIAARTTCNSSTASRYKCSESNEDLPSVSMATHRCSRRCRSSLSLLRSLPLENSAQRS